MTDRATRHAERVAAGDVTAGKLHELACRRHLEDLNRQGADYPFYFDEKSAMEIINYAEMLTIAEGDEPKQVKLIGSQAFGFGCTFGWKRKDNGKRRFRRRYKSVARQNGKSFENGIMGTYIAAFGGYNYGKLFTAAPKRRQSRIAWDEMNKFLRIDKELGEYFLVKEYNNLILAKNTQCTIEALSREGGLDEGFRAIYCSIDEIHQHKDNKIYSKLYRGTRALPETLVSMITTRGDNLNSFCKEMDDYAVQILHGMATADDMFIDIHCMDDEDDPWDEKNWIKSNPMMEINPMLLESLRTDAATARAMGGQELMDFMIKDLNRWMQNTDRMFVRADKFAKCASKRTLEDMRGKSCWVGLDLSSGGDLTSYALEFELDGIGKKRFFVHSHSFMPRGRMQEHIEGDLAPYGLWESMELITVTGGEMDFKNDYKFIVSELRRIRDEYNLTYLGIGIDPHNADGVLADLEEFGCPVMIIVQSCKSLNDATVDIQLLVKSEDFEYTETNELLAWSFYNAETVKNSFDEIKIDKKDGKRTKRIDPCDAVVNAHTVRMRSGDKETVDMDNVLSDYFKAMGWNTGGTT